MPRRPNTRPTLIYWLYDMRPETITADWPNGKPFYCGKTVESLKKRFRTHFKDAQKWSSRRTAIIVTACGRQHLHIRLMETVPVGVDWAERERFWIATLKHLYPGATNIAFGGQGPAGYVPTVAQREQSRIAMLGNKNAKGTTYSDEQRRAMSERYRGRKASLETRAKMSASHRGSPSVEERERIAGSLRGKPHSEERKAAMRAGWAKRKAALKGVDNSFLECMTPIVVN